MKHAILRIAGTFGSGKTTAARQFMEEHEAMKKALGK